MAHQQRETKVLLISDIDGKELSQLLYKYQLTLNVVASDDAIPGSFWGDQEAGLIQDQLYVRPDTPLHSVLHESCHYICMDQHRRAVLNTNAGGTANEENAVCYLQILLTAELSFISKNKMMCDMDNWGYSFRLGSAKAWFESDAEDAHEWLVGHKLINKNGETTFRLRQ
ncbi:MAG: hypothetical protein ACPG47_00425 [Leucothrix sp.]